MALRRSLLIWGWGQASLGDRRAWLLAIVQVLAIADVLIIGPQLIDTTLWLLLFLPIVVLAVVWVGQAVNAHRRAFALGGAPGGELQLALFLPLLLAVFTAFWLVGGRHGSAASTVEAYMEAWESNRPDIAVGLFPYPDRSWGSIDLARASIAAQWNSDLNNVSRLIDRNRAIYGPTSGLDPQHPFRSVRVEEGQLNIFSRSGSVRGFVIEVVRTEQFQTTLLGLIPTTGQRTVVVAPVAFIGVAEEAAAPGTMLPLTVWKISSYNQTPLTPP